MLTIIIGSIASVIIFCVLYCIFDNSLFVFCGVLGILLSIFLGLSYPLSGYNDWELVDETELISLSSSTVSGGTGLVYVSLSADNAYTYRFEVDSSFGTKSSKNYKTATIINEDNITEIEDPNCKKAVLKKYKKTAKKSIWTFGLWADKISYVFYVPEDTINKNIKIK